MKSLNSKLNPEKLVNLFDVYQKQPDYNEKNAYLDRVMEANKGIMREVMKMSLSAELKEIIMEGAERNGWLDEITKKAAKEVEQARLEADKNVEIIKLEVERAKRAEEKSEKARLEVEEKAIEVAKKLLKRGLSIDDISEDTGLAVDRIVELQQRL